MVGMMKEGKGGLFPSQWWWSPYEGWRALMVKVMNDVVGNKWKVLMMPY